MTTKGPTECPGDREECGLCDWFDVDEGYIKCCGKLDNDEPCIHDTPEQVKEWLRGNEKINL